MRISDSFSKLKKCRVRLQRARDGKIFSGRMVKLSMVDAVLSIEKANLLLVGDDVSLEVHGPAQKILSRGRVVLTSQNKISVEILGEMKHTSATESARIDVKDVMARVHYDGAIMIANVFDVSKEGIAIRLMDAVPPGKTIQLSVQIRNESISIRGVTRYCRELNDGLGHTRIGIQLVHESRVASAKWFNFFDTVQEAA